MKIIVERTPFLKALSHVQAVVEPRNTAPILSNLLLSAKDDHILMQATDLELEVREKMSPVRIERSGATTVHAHLLYSLVSKLPEDAPITLEVDDAGSGQLKINCKRSRFTLQTMPEAEYPGFSDGEFPHEFQLGAAALGKLIDTTQFAISSEETRYYLNGIFLHATQALDADNLSSAPGAQDETGRKDAGNAIDPASASSLGPAAENGEDARASADVIRAVATDGHRLALRELPLPEGCDNMPGIIVPRKAVLNIRKLLDDTESAVRLEISENKIRVSVNDVVLTSKLIDGNYPDYQRVIPASNTNVLNIDRDMLRVAVDRVATLSRERGAAVKLKLSDDKADLSLDNADYGSGIEEINVEYSASPLQIGFNASYLLDIVKQISDSGAVLRFFDETSPILVHARDYDNALFVLMPMRV